FIEDSCKFYIANRDRIEEMQEELNDAVAAAQVFADMAKPNILRVTALNAYIQFCSKVMILAAQGIPVPQSIIMDVRSTVDKALLSATLTPDQITQLTRGGR
ncbi:unnamed protein product, partial [marine sediment metagenome]